LRSRHWGVDFAGRIGAPVRAANRGVVALVADLYYSGTTVLVDHGAGLVTGYFHLSRVLVVPGDTVDVGQLIGRVGSSGRVTRSHLQDRKSTRLNSSHVAISYAVFCLKKKKTLILEYLLTCQQ